MSLHGVTARGRHGANPGERDDPQEFEVDLDVEVDVEADALDATVDYRMLADVARRTVETQSLVLLESLAHAVASAIVEHAGVITARATVRKPSAARSLGLREVSATATSGDTPDQGS